MTPGPGQPQSRSAPLGALHGCTRRETLQLGEHLGRPGHPREGPPGTRTTTITTKTATHDRGSQARGPPTPQPPTQNGPILGGQSVARCFQASQTIIRADWQKRVKNIKECCHLPPQGQLPVTPPCCGCPCCPRPPSLQLGPPQAPWSGEGGYGASSVATDRTTRRAWSAPTCGPLSRCHAP